MAGLIGCLNIFDVKNVIGSDYVHDSDLYTSFMDAVAAKNQEVQHPAVGEFFGNHFFYKQMLDTYKKYGLIE